MQDAPLQLPFLLIIYYKLRFFLLKIQRRDLKMKVATFISVNDKEKRIDEAHDQKINNWLEKEGKKIEIKEVKFSSSSHAGLSLGIGQIGSFSTLILATQIFYEEK
jgi:hypothetical protein